jgi:hypothetical protein
MRDVTVMRALVVLAVFGLLLTACGGTAPAATPTPLPPLTLAPPADATFLEGCATADLENWVERVDFLLRDFVSQLNLAQGQSPNLVRTTLQRMVPLRDALVAIPAPDGCAGDAHRLMLQMANSAIDHLQAYANGEISDINAAMEDVDQMLGDLQGLQGSLETLLDAQFQANQATN